MTRLMLKFPIGIERGYKVEICNFKRFDSWNSLGYVANFLYRFYSSFYGRNMCKNLDCINDIDVEYYEDEPFRRVFVYNEHVSEHYLICAELIDMKKNKKGLYDGRYVRHEVKILEVLKEDTDLEKQRKLCFEILLQYVSPQIAVSPQIEKTCLSQINKKLKIEKKPMS